MTPLVAAGLAALSCILGLFLVSFGNLTWVAVQTYTLDTGRTYLRHVNEDLVSDGFGRGSRGVFWIVIGAVVVGKLVAISPFYIVHLLMGRGSVIRKALVTEILTSAVRACPDIPTAMVQADLRKVLGVAQQGSVDNPAKKL